MEVTRIFEPNFESGFTDTEQKIWDLILSGVKQNVIDARQMLDNGAYRHVNDVVNLNLVLKTKEKKLGIEIKNVNYEELLKREEDEELARFYDYGHTDDIGKSDNLVRDLSQLLSGTRKKIKKSDLFTEVSGDQKKNMNRAQRILLAEKIFNENKNLHWLYPKRALAYERKIKILKEKHKKEISSENIDNEAQ
jgi:hypothetical protein